MLIGLIADTHIPEAGPDLWPQVYERFRTERVEAILHAGDIHILPVLDRLEQRTGAPVFACRGNGDDGGAGRPVCPDDPRLRPTWTLDLAGYRVGLCHDMEVDPVHRPVRALMQYHFGGPCDVVVFGDTHVPVAEVMDGTLLVNPGSPMYPRNMDTSLGTIGFLHLTPAAAEAWVEPLPPAAAPAGDLLDHHAVAARYPDQWVLFRVYAHDRHAGLSLGAVVAEGFAAEEAVRVERRYRSRNQTALLLTYHTAAPPPRGIARQLSRDSG